MMYLTKSLNTIVDLSQMDCIYRENNNIVYLTRSGQRVETSYDDKEELNFDFEVIRNKLGLYP